jgi:predicted ATPase
VNALPGLTKITYVKHSMKKHRLRSLQIRNLLSFGENSPEIELGNLNVLVGPNGSGKSNLIEIIGLLRSTPTDFAAEVGDSGGVAELLWKGKSKTKDKTATLQVRVDPIGVNRTILYHLSFTRTGAQLKIVDERI